MIWKRCNPLLNRHWHWHKKAIIREELSIVITSLERLTSNGGNYLEAHKNYINAHRIADSLAYKKGAAYAINNLGVVNWFMNDLNQALDYYMEAVRLNKDIGDSTLLVTNLFNIGIIYHDRKVYDSAKVYYLQSLKNARIRRDSMGLADAYNSMGNLSLDQKNLKQAIQYFSASMKIAEKAGITQLTFNPQLNLGVVFTLQGQYQEAEYQLQKALRTARQLQARDFVMSAYDYLSRLDSAKGDFQRALVNYKQYATIRDSIYDDNLSKQFVEFQTQFDSRRKERENENLKASEARNQKIIAHQWNMMVLFGFLLLIITILLIILSKSNRQRKKINQELREINEEKDAIMQMVAHDLRAPLANIKGLIQLLKQEDELKSEQKKMIHMVEGEIIRGDDMLRDLLDMDLLEQGSPSLHPTTLDLFEFVSGHSLKFEQAAINKQIDLHFQQPAKEIIIRTDPQFLSRILDNLLSNAIKFSPFHSSICLKVSSQTDYAVISVKDEGPGISRKDQKKLFQKFQKLSAQPTNGETSSGLGLAVTKALVQHLNGKIQLSSQLGIGTEFQVFLPLFS